MSEWSVNGIGPAPDNSHVILSNVIGSTYPRCAEPSPATGSVAPHPIWSNGSGLNYGQPGYPVSTNPLLWSSNSDLGPDPLAHPTTTDGVRLAPWPARAAAFALDFIAFLIVNIAIFNNVLPTVIPDLRGWWQDLLVAFATGAPSLPMPWESQYGHSFLAMSLIPAAIWFCYSTVMPSCAAATVGQLALRLRVVPQGRGRNPYGLSWSAALVRSSAFIIINAVPVLNMINLLCPLYQAKRQTLHDVIAGTQVVSQTSLRNEMGHAMPVNQVVATPSWHA